MMINLLSKPDWFENVCLLSETLGKRVRFLEIGALLERAVRILVLFKYFLINVLSAVPAACEWFWDFLFDFVGWGPIRNYILRRNVIPAGHHGPLDGLLNLLNDLVLEMPPPGRVTKRLPDRLLDIPDRCTEFLSDGLLYGSTRLGVLLELIVSVWIYGFLDLLGDVLCGRWIFVLCSFLLNCGSETWRFAGVLVEEFF